MKIDIDRQRITDRMNALGLSEREVVRASEIPYAQFRQARRTGQFDGHITLTQLHRVAAHLGLTVSELLATTGSEPTPPAYPSEPTDGEDVASLVPLLLAVPRLVATPHIARTLGWSRERLNRALTDTPAALDDTGLCLREIRGSVKIEPINASAKAVRNTIARLQTSTYGLIHARPRHCSASPKANGSRTATSANNSNSCSAPSATRVASRPTTEASTSQPMNFGWLSRTSKSATGPFRFRPEKIGRIRHY